MAKSKPPKKPVAPQKVKMLAHHAALTKALLTDDPPAEIAILQPVNNAYAEPGVDLRVLCSTNRPDLRYKMTVTDVTDPLNPVAVGEMDIPAPIDHGSTRLFAADLPGAWFVAAHLYEIRVSVHPDDGDSPPHNPAFVHVTCVPQQEWFVAKYNGVAK